MDKFRITVALAGLYSAVPTIYNIVKLQEVKMNYVTPLGMHGQQKVIHHFEINLKKPHFKISKRIYTMSAFRLAN